MGMEVPKRKCQLVLRPQQNLDGPLWQLPWLARCHLPRCGLAKIGDRYLVSRWIPGSRRPICPTKKTYSCSVSRCASHVMIYISDMVLTAGCLLTKPKFPLVLIVISYCLPFERCLDLSIPHIEMLLGPQKPARGTANSSQTRGVTHSGRVSFGHYNTPCSGRSVGDTAIAGEQLLSIRCVSPDADSAWWNSC